MVLCWIALPIFLFLSIFSAKYRRLTIESIQCLWRTATLRPCKSSLDQRLRSDITAKLMKSNPRLAKGFYNNYKTISFLILVVMLISAYFTGAGIYNYIKYGNCNGADSTAFCVINAALGKETPNQATIVNSTQLNCFNQTSPLKIS